MNFRKIRRLADRLSLQLKQASQTLRSERKAIREQRHLVSRALKSQVIVQTVAQQVQKQAHERIAAVVSRCLKAVFDDPYRFKIVFDRKRGKTEARLVFVRKDLELDPIDGCGGGVIDVAAFALRLACLMLRKPQRRRLLVLDEPFKFVSDKKEYRSRVRDLLETLADEMKVQFAIVTHDPTLEIGKVVEIG